MTATAETTSLAAAKMFLTDLGDHLRQIISRIDTARATLANRGLDVDTLTRIDRVRAQTNALAALAATGVEHLTDYHAHMEQAVNHTPEAADTDFYQPASTVTAPRGHYNPDQPRAADGKWIKVGDVLGYADNQVCYGTDRVAGTSTAPVDLALIEYPDEPGLQAGAYISVATPPGSFNPVTGQGDGGHAYCAPQLDAAEAETTAGHLDNLADMADAGYRPPAPTKHTRARQHLELLLAEGKARKRDRVIVGGDDDDVPLTNGDLLKLLSEADPTLSAPQTRHAVRAHAAVAAGGEDGTVWLDLQPGTDGEMSVVVTAVQGTESPDDEVWQQYVSRHTSASARELAGKLRAFAAAARRRSEPA